MEMLLGAWLWGCGALEIMDDEDEEDDSEVTDDI